MKRIKLGEICEIVSGSTPKTSVAEYWDGDIDWITPAELTDEMYIIEESQRKITHIAVQKTGLKPFPKGTVILSSRAPIGKVAIAGKEMFCNQGFKNLICSDRVDSGYLYWYLKGHTDYLNSLGRGATFKEISKTIVENIEIPLPDLNKQINCANTLKKCWDLLVILKKQVEAYDNLIKSRFVEMFGDMANPKCRYPKYRLVDVCKDSDDIKCGPFGTQLNKDEYQTEGIAVWEIPQINSGFSNKPVHFLTIEKAEQLKAYSIEPGDIAMSRKGNVGKCGLFPLDYESGIIHSDVLRIRVDNRCVNPCFLMYQLHYSRAIQRQIEMVSSGAIMAGINVTKLKQIKVHVPDLELQKQFATFVAQTDKLKLTTQKSLKKLEILKKSLMQEYFG